MTKERSTLLRFIRLAVIVGVIGFLAIQFVRPTISNPPTTSELATPPEVKRVLQKSCYNCHSNETKLSWLDYPAPAYWLVAHDVKEARRRLNFSEFGKLPPARQKAVVWEAINQVQLGAMPLPSYLAVHPEAQVSDADLEVLKNYLHPPGATPATSETDVAAADKQYDTWIHAASHSIDAKPALNDIAFMPDYKNWKVVSTTDRFDNNTLRIIFGNDVAIRAIAEHHINPWPDGTTFAKGAWLKQTGADGVTRMGTFLVIEFMIKDAQKYASTGGWGYARWLGTDLKPYGNDANFANECVGCHNPVRKNDYVYTFPLEGQQ